MAESYLINKLYKDSGTARNEIRIQSSCCGRMRTDKRRKKFMKRAQDLLAGELDIISHLRTLRFLTMATKQRLTPEAQEKFKKHAT